MGFFDLFATKFDERNAFFVYTENTGSAPAKVSIRGDTSRSVSVRGYWLEIENNRLRIVRAESTTLYVPTGYSCIQYPPQCAVVNGEFVFENIDEDTRWFDDKPSLKGLGKRLSHRRFQIINPEKLMDVHKKKK